MIWNITGSGISPDLEYHWIWNITRPLVYGFRVSGSCPMPRAPYHVPHARQPNEN